VGESGLPVNGLHRVVTEPKHHVDAILSRGRLNVARQSGGVAEHGAHVGRGH